MSGGGTIENRAGAERPHPLPVQLAERRPGGEGIAAQTAVQVEPRPLGPLPDAGGAPAISTAGSSGCGLVTNCTHPRGAEDHDEGGALRAPASRGQSHDTGVAFWQRRNDQRSAARMVWFGATIPAEGGPCQLSLATSFHAPPSCLAYQYHLGRRERTRAACTSNCSVQDFVGLTTHATLVQVDSTERAPH